MSGAESTSNTFPDIQQFSWMHTNESEQSPILAMAVIRIFNVDGVMARLTASEALGTVAGCMLVLNGIHHVASPLLWQANSLLLSMILPDAHTLIDIRGVGRYTIFSSVLQIGIKCLYSFFRWLAPRLVLLDYAAIAYVIRMPKARELEFCVAVTEPSEERDTKCSHCWESMELGQQLEMHTLCKNTWHAPCITEWVQSRDGGHETCPICAGPLTASSAVVEPDGKHGHTWRPAAMTLVTKRIWILCLVWSAVMLAVDTARVNGLMKEQDTSIILIDKMWILVCHWLITVMQIEAHKVNILYLRGYSQETKHCVMAAIVLLSSFGLASSLLQANGEKVTKSSLATSTISLAVSGAIMSSTVLIKKRAFVFNTLQENGVHIH